MSKQDRGGVRTAADLERKYNFAGMRKATEMNTVGLNKTNKEMEDFVNQTLGNIENIQKQIDGKVDTYYYIGVPSLSNLPAAEWDEEDYVLHVGDLYYDGNTGYAYRFIYNSTTGNYEWKIIEDDAVTEALAIANAAKDTADKKRRVFVVQPAPPYDEGDLWLNNKEIYVCSKPKSTGSFESGDFITATDYANNSTVDKLDEKVDQFIVAFNNLAAKSVTTETLSAEVAELGYAKIDELEAEVGKFGYLKIAELSSEVAKFGYATAESLKAVDAKFGSLNATYATLDLANIEAGSITAAMIGEGVVGTVQIADGSITDAKIVELTANKITAGTLSVERLEIRGSDKSIVYALNNITGALQSQNVDTLNGEILTKRTITADKIVAEAITASEIASRTITANEILAHTITANEIKAGTITATEIASGTITADKIKSGTITADKIDVNNLFGQNITASGYIKGKRIISSGIDFYGEPSTLDLDAGRLRFESVAEGQLPRFVTDVSAHQILLNYEDHGSYKSQLWMNGNRLELTIIDGVNKNIITAKDSGVILGDSGLTVELNGAVKENGTKLEDKYASASSVLNLSGAFNDHKSDTSCHVTVAEKQAWNSKSTFSGSWYDLLYKPTKVSAFDNDAGYVSSAKIKDISFTAGKGTVFENKSKYIAELRMVVIDLRIKLGSPTYEANTTHALLTIESAYKPSQLKALSAIQVLSNDNARVYQAAMQTTGELLMKLSTNISASSYISVQGCYFV